MRTQQDIDFMILELEAIKNLVPPRTLLDEDTHQAIDNQIAVLEHKMNENDVWNEWPSGHDDAYNRDRAMLALAWLLGNDDANPVEGWQKIIGDETE